jgi:beta-barrel assembly-enhancing protease
MYQRARRTRTPARRFNGGRILIAVAVAAFALFSYFGSREFNPITEEDQYVGITPDQEIALGLQAAPEMAAQFGGLHPDQRAQDYLESVCRRLIENSDAGQAEWPYSCSLLEDEQTINAFALPGGQLFITAGLLNELQTEGQLAGIMAHEIGHAVARHSAQQIAKQQLTQGLTGAVVIASYDPQNPGSQATGQIAAVVGQLVNMSYSREHELESDRLGVRFMTQAGYDPRKLIDVMRILAESGGGAAQPEFFSTHPNPENRVAAIEAAIEAEFPNGVPEGLDP